MSPAYKNTNRRDNNDRSNSPIAQTWNRLKVPRVQLHPGQCADHVIVTPFGIRFIEVKPEGKENDLTEKELEFMKIANTVCPGCYVVITNEQQAADVALTGRK
jgi:hypothetical protein